MSNKIFALDIREDHIHCLLIRTGLKGNWIDMQASVSLADAPEPENRFAWGIRRITDQIDPSDSVCLVSVPPGRISYRNLQVPFKDRKKVRQILPFELEPLLPYDVNELSIDFLPVRQSDQMDLIAATVNSEMIDGMLATLQEFDISPRIVTIGGIATALCLANQSGFSAKDFIFIDLEESIGTLIVVVSGVIHLIQPVRLGKDTDAAAKGVRISGDIPRILTSLETLFDVDFQPEAVFLSGTGSTDDALLQAIKDSLSIAAVEHVNLLEDSRFKLTYSVQGEAYDPEWMNGPLGLAGIEFTRIMPFNFSRQHYAIQKYWGENKNEFIATGMLVIFVFILMMFSVVMEAHFLQKRITQLNHQIADIFQSTFPKTKTIVDPVGQMQANLRQMKEKEAYSTGAGTEPLNIDILNDLSRLIPAQVNVVLTRFVSGDSSIMIAGVTDTFNAVDDIKNRMEKSPHFKNITISSANMDKTIGRVRFNIRADLSGA